MNAVVIPNPDPTSRYPTAYCKKCGNGWPEYLRCALDTKIAERNCDFTGEVALTKEMKAVRDAFLRGEVTAGTRNLGSWGPPKLQL